MKRFHYLLNVRKQLFLLSFFICLQQLSLAAIHQFSSFEALLESCRVTTSSPFTANELPTPPTVKISYPLNGSSFPENSNLSVFVSASDNGFVQYVDLFVNDQSARRVFQSPYQWWGGADPLLTNMSAGVYNIKAVAVDNENNRTEVTTTITILGGSNQAPTVSFTSPSNGQEFKEGDNLDVNVNASDSDGTVTDVALYFDNVLVNRDFSAPYSWLSFNYSLLQNLQVGTHTLRAVVQDNAGASTERSISIVVTEIPADNIPPTVSFDIPLQNQVFTEGVTVFVRTNATDSDGAIANVALYLNNALVRQDPVAPYEWGITDPLLQNMQAGTYTLRAVATDNDGASTETIRDFQVISPSVISIDFQTLQDQNRFPFGTDLTVEVNASDSNGSIQYVDLFLNGVLVRRDANAPYQWGDVDDVLKDLSAGTYLLRAVATDDGGNEATTSIRIWVLEEGASSTAPIVSFVEPLDQASLRSGADLDVEVLANDDVAVVSVELFLNDVAVDTELAAPYQWNAVDFAALRNLQFGSYTLKAVVTDTDNEQGESTIQFAVRAPSNDPFSLIIEEPVAQEIFQEGDDLYVSAEIEDPTHGIKEATLYFDGALVRQRNSTPYEWGNNPALDPSLKNLQAGSHTVRIVAINNIDEEVQKSVTISVNAKPTPVFSNISDGDTFQEGADLIVQVDASDSNGTVSSVDLLLNGESVRLDVVEPFEWGLNDAALQNMAPGTYTLQAIATDNNGGRGENTISIEVLPNNIPPALSFVTPGDDSIEEGTDLLVEINANDSDGTIARVELFFEDQLVRSDEVMPYQWGNETDDTDLMDLQIGTYKLLAIGIDNDGDSTVIEKTIQVVKENQPPVVTFDTPFDEEGFPVGTELYVNVGAYDLDGTITAVDLYLDDVLVRTIVSAPYEWDGAAQDALLRNMAVGTYNLKAIATDDKGAQTESELTFTIFEANQSPDLTFITPLDLAIIDAGTDLEVEVEAIDADGSISEVKLYLNDELVGTDITAPYEWGTSNQNDQLLQNLQTGTYILRAEAIDNEGAKESIEIMIEVIRANQAPRVLFDTPFDLQLFEDGTNLYVNVGAFDEDGTIAEVSLYLDDALVRTLTAAPYEWGRVGLEDTMLENLLPGVYTLRAEALDNEGAMGQATVLVEVFRTNVLPIVDFIEPINGAQYLQSETVEVMVNAIDPDRQVDSVELFLNGTSVGSIKMPPYQWGAETAALQNLTNGIYRLSATVTDDEGGQSQAKVEFEVLRSNQAPLVVFSTPTDGDVFTAGTDLSVTVGATDSDGTIESVSLFLNSDLVGTDTTDPFQWGTDEALLQNLAIGNYVLLARATDNEGAITDESITFVVEERNELPTVSIDSPMDGAIFQVGSTIDVMATASDTDGSITAVALFLNDVLVSEDVAAPYEWIGATELSNLAAGTYELKVIATDDKGGQGEALITIEVTPDNIPPTVSFTTPLNQASLPASMPLEVLVDATDSDGTVMSVSLYLNETFIREEIGAPFEWGASDAALQNLANGTYRLRAVATDDDGATAEAIITITIVEGNDLPILTFNRPLDQELFTAGSDLDVFVSVIDLDGSIANVTLFLNDQVVRADAAFPYQWNAANGDAALEDLQPGDYVLKAVATDNENGMSEATINITVELPNIPPTVDFNAPNDQQTFMEGENVSVSIDAADSDGSVASVELLLNDQLVRTLNQAPYDFGANDPLLQNMQAGNYTLKAIATDDEGASTETSIDIEVMPPNVPPTVSFSTPADGATFIVGANLAVTANAMDSDGTITLVSLFLDDQLVRTDQAAPYSWGDGDALLQNLQVGTYTLKLEATDNEGASTESSINITIEAAPNVPPTVSFTAPTNGTTIPAGTNLQVTADAMDLDGTIASVSLSLNDQLVGIDEDAPYSWGTGDPLLQNLQAGTYVLKLVATDDEGATTESSITITVVANTDEPIVNFIEPSDQANVASGTDLYVLVEAIPSSGSIRQVELYLNDQFVRKERGAPYEWGKAQQNDLLLQNLVVGNYTLRAVATDNRRRVGEKSIQISVVNNFSGDPKLNNRLTTSQLHPVNPELQAAPNPSTGLTTVNFTVQKAAPLQIELYNQAGQKVLTVLEQQTLTTGNYQLQLDASHLPVGSYYLQLTTNTTAVVQALILVQ